MLLIVSLLVISGIKSDPAVKPTELASAEQATRNDNRAGWGSVVL
jgi:hypothetical protein